ncbi:hypothetical protein PMAYCL1PPCAC_19670, partial [Pristionchus mayeri]
TWISPPIAMNSRVKFCPWRKGKSPYLSSLCHFEYRVLLRTTQRSSRRTSKWRAISEAVFRLIVKRSASQSGTPTIYIRRPRPNPLIGILTGIA